MIDGTAIASSPNEVWVVSIQSPFGLKTEQYCSSERSGSSYERLLRVQPRHFRPSQRKSALASIADIPVALPKPSIVPKGDQVRRGKVVVF
jgi:hypothetical protein